MVRRTICIALCVGFLVQGVGFAGNDSTREARYKIPGQGKLYLEVPTSWEQESRQHGKVPRFDITLSLPGVDAVVMISAIWNPRDEFAFDRDALYGTVVGSIESARADSVEKDLPVVEFRADTCFGFYFSATDKKRDMGPGDYRHVTQGMAAASGLGLSFTVLSNENTAAVVDASLAMLKGARFERKK